jgi:antitoxin ParD1/3/4
MATLNVTLPSDMIDFVESEVSVGDYASSDEVIREALHRLRHDREHEAEMTEALRADIEIGLRQAREGQLSSLTIDDIAGEVLRTARLRQ